MFLCTHSPPYCEWQKFNGSVQITPVKTTSLDKRISASVIALGGGDIPYLLAYSSEKGIKKKRVAFMSKEGITDEDEFYEKMKPIITTDPMRFAEYINAKKVLLILARFDTTVPYVKGMELAKKMGGPETIKLFSGHFTALPFIFYVRSKAYQFFERKFADPGLLLHQ